MISWLSECEVLTSYTTLKKNKIGSVVMCCDSTRDNKKLKKEYLLKQKEKSSTEFDLTSI